ncbi:MAG: FHA domain-containing protein [Acidobacteria bacterium]|nr:FHA domain-containing protein [Acidobacteriota bacterium]
MDAELAAYKQEFAVLFADITGSTRFFDRRGDVSGVTMVQGFVDRATPPIRRFGGRVVKTLGDAILAYFADPREAVKAAVALQQEFVAFNARRPPADRIELRIGVNYGSGFVKENDVFGDVVNVAARVQALAGANEILISAAVAEATRPMPWEFKPLGPVELRGKSTAQELLEVAWQEERPGTAPTAYSLLLLDAAGAPTAEYALTQSETILGRREGDIRFPRDPLLATRHARFRCEPSGLWVEDLSPTGVFLRLREPAALKPGDVFVLGKQLIEFQPAAGGKSREAALLVRRRRFPLKREVTVLGRTKGEVTFPEDAFLSAAHARIRIVQGAFYLEDLGSTNGSFLKIRGRSLLASGDTLLCGSQVLRVR